MKNDSRENVGSVPGVSDTSLVDELFRLKSRLAGHSELAILLRPIVIEGNEVCSKMIKVSDDRLPTLRPASLEDNE